MELSSNAVGFLDSLSPFSAYNSRSLWIYETTEEELGTKNLGPPFGVSQTSLESKA